MSEARILLVDDNTSELERCASAFEEVSGITVLTESRSTRAAELLSSPGLDLLITDLRMPMVDGLDLLKAAHAHDPELPVVMLTGFPSVHTAVEALKLGAADYLTKPVNLEELLAVTTRLLKTRRLEGEHRLLRRQMDRDYAPRELVGLSPAMLGLYDAIRRLAQSDVDVFIFGETGTGKELVARSLHEKSHHAPGRFVPVDCGAVPEHLLESELFGHERGAFTGAHARHVGLMEFADGGTFFLDELHALAPALQSKLLRVLQERRFRRVGGNHEISVGLRVVAAANRDPNELVHAGRLREDLFYRLNVGRIDVPPLRDRVEDIPLLVDCFIARYARSPTNPVTGVSAEAMRALVAYPWPGNVRELENAIRRALAWTRTDVLTPTDLPDEIESAADSGPAGPAGPFGPSGPARGTASFFDARERHIATFERGHLTKLLRACAGDVSEAARQADMPRGTFYRLMKKHGLRAGPFRPES